VNTGVQSYILLVPTLVVFLALEVFLIRRRGGTIDRREYLQNVTLSFGMAIVDLLVMGANFSVYAAILPFSLFEIKPTPAVYLASLLLVDFVFYWAHVGGHRFPFFWPVHSVHHQVKEYNLSAGFRQPWFHKTNAFLFFFILAFIGIPIPVLSSVYAAVVVSQFWLHTETTPREIPVLSWIVMTPTQHRVHHGTNPKYLDRNFGVLFSFWDRIFGTYTPERAPVHYGVSDEFDQSNIFWVNIFPWLVFGKRLRAAIREGRGFAYFFGRYRSPLVVEDPYRKWPIVDRPEGYVETTIYSAGYFFAQNSILAGLAIFCITSPLPFASQMILGLSILISFGWIGLLYDRKRVPPGAEPLRIALYAAVLGFLRPELAVVFLVAEFAVWTAFRFPRRSLAR